MALTEAGLARSRTEAAALVADGVVTVNDAVATKPAQHTGPGDRLRVRTDGPRHVSRAAHKLAGALTVFTDVDPRGRDCLDAGASTGGFTQMLLQAGAARVIAVDVGHDQMAPQLRADERVEVREGLNIRATTPQLTGGQVDLVVADLSFISLRLVMDALAGLCAPGADLVLMVKPQFEVGRRALPKGGVVRDPDQRRGAVVGVAEAALRAGLDPRGAARSPLPGRDGNVEVFLWLRREPPTAGAPEPPDAGTSAVRSAAPPAARPAGLADAAAAWVDAQCLVWS